MICFIPICSTIEKNAYKSTKWNFSRTETEEENEIYVSDDAFSEDKNNELFDEPDICEKKIHVLKLVEKSKKLNRLSKLSSKRHCDHINKRK